MDAVAADVRISSGTLHALRSGSRGGPAVVCVPGLSANARSFDAVAAALAARGRDVVALDLRGRGMSPAGAPGSHGWVRHAADVLEAAAALGLGAVDLVGHSMGAFVAMQAVALGGGRVRRLVLVDGVGPPDPAAIPPIIASVQRLGVVAPSADAYWQEIRARGAVAPFEGLWEAHARYELEDAPGGGVRARTSRDAVVEDMVYGSQHDARLLWPALALPTLLVRATQPLPPTDGFIVGVALRDAFRAAVRGAEVAEVDANHYGVVAHPDAVEAIAGFLERR
jgi:pimeloyl-ACP methyl ester carboxylesterase